ncbi:MAG: helicase-exonuclease AddAB subunit AddA [Verrucomicrobiota bacterium]|nr:helicase-exonuclease AddAB subunit AddA [Verrucomicrobiota bacterium]
MVTFTEAAATEMRKRIRENLESRFREQPHNQYLAEQIALLDTAYISTLHSFCLRLVRENFFELGLDPQLTVLSDEQSRLLARETLEIILQAHYEGQTPVAEAVQQLIEEQGRGWDKPVRELVLRLHHYTQTLSDPEKWFEDQFAFFEKPEPIEWKKWLLEVLGDWQKNWLEILQNQSAENVNAKECAAALNLFSENATREKAALILEQIIGADQIWPAKKKTKFREPIEKIFEEAEFLHSLCAETKDSDPLQEDWTWVRPQIIALLNLAREFAQKFSEAKREMGGLDFHDLEQFSLKLLRDKKIAARWREKFRLIFVDEYQDINAAQDEILKNLGGENEHANRFLVGDVKQSIYRFRLANPRIFLEYQTRWKNFPHSSVVPLSDNFRSHETILNFINPLFAALMKSEIGGVEYDEETKLRFGNATQRAALTVVNDSSPRVEWHIRLKGQKFSQEENGEEENSDFESLSDTEKEARLVARRLIELKQNSLVWEKEKQRAAEWSDMVILLRSPSKKVEAYAKEFDRLGVPLVTARSGFYGSTEVTDLLSLLQILDNPSQDFPLLAVLRSPFVGLSLDELATIRLANRSGHFWNALLTFQKIHNSKFTIQNSETADSVLRKIDFFLERFHQWRQLPQQMSLSRCLEVVLDQTHYSAWLATQNRAAQRQANVERLLNLTRQFDSFQGEGLFRFLKLVEAQQDAEIETEPASIETKNAVRLMSIHQSKGLEFPIVVLADLGKRFNFDDLKARIILDEKFGVCPQVKPPQTRQTYPSLPHWLAQRRQKKEAIGEELRLLYVALTRAQDRLILIGTASKNAAEKWTKMEGRLHEAEILRARNFLSWLGIWASPQMGEAAWLQSGKNSLFSWTLYDEKDPRLAIENKILASDDLKKSEEIEPAKFHALQSRLQWRYPFSTATTAPAKTSVSALRRRYADETADEVKPLFDFKLRSSARNNKLSAAEIGIAHHLFLEWVALENVGDKIFLQEEAMRLGREKILTAEEIAALDLNALAGFWKSEIGQKILEHRNEIQQELKFTARFSPFDLMKLNLAIDTEKLEDEFVVVQGALDLAVILREEIWLLDFKTDEINNGEMEKKAAFYKSQIALYAEAIGRIYHRPVTQCWLHFLKNGATVSMRTEASQKALLAC